MFHGFLRMAHGAWPNDCCLHRCDNRACVNPDHLFEGTQTDNNIDMDTKGRRARVPVGERQWNAKLTEQDVRNIRAAVAAGEKHEIVRARYGLAAGAVGRIVSRKLWRHVA